MYDKHVNSVIRKITDRAIVGLEKYGVNLERDDLSLVDWITHAQEEAMDLALYLEVIKSKLQEQVPEKVEVKDDFNVSKTKSIPPITKLSDTPDTKGLFERLEMYGYKPFSLTATELDALPLNSSDLTVEYVFLDSWFQKNWNLLFIVRLDSAMPFSYYYSVSLFIEEGFDFKEVATNRGKSTLTRHEATHAAYLQALEYLKSKGIGYSVGDFYKSPLFLKDSI